MDDCKFGDDWYVVGGDVELLCVDCVNVDVGIVVFIWNLVVEVVDVDGFIDVVC